MAKTPVIDFEFNLKADQANKAIDSWLAKSNAAYKTNTFNRGNADRAIAAQAKKYADMEVQYQGVKTKEIVKIVEEANKRKLILDQTYQNKRIEGASQATLKEIALQKQQLQQYTNTLNQMLRKRDEVLHQGAGASIGLLGVGRNLIGGIPGLPNVSGITEALGGLGEAAGISGMAMTGLSVGVTAAATGLAIGTKTAIDMQEALATLKAQTVLTDEQITHIKENSLSFGAILNDDATKAVMAYQQVAKILGEDITKDQQAFDNITFSALTFSKAIGGGDIQAQIEDITMIANQFGMIGKDAKENAENFQRVSDVLVQGSKIGAGGIEKITEAVKQGGLEAYKAGLNFNEFVAIVGGAGKSIDIERIGSMTNMLVNRMQSWGTSAAKQLHELGLAFDDIDPKQKGFIQSMETLGDALKKNESSPEYGDITQKLFGYGGRGGRVLADAIIQNIDKIKEFNSELNGSDGVGAAAEAAAAHLITVKSEAGKLWETVKKFTEPAGEKIIGWFAKLLKTTNDLTAAQNEYNEALQKFDDKSAALNSDVEAMYQTQKAQLYTNLQETIATINSKGEAEEQKQKDIKSAQDTYNIELENMERDHQATMAGIGKESAIERLAAILKTREDAAKKFGGVSSVTKEAEEKYAGLDTEEERKRYVDKYVADHVKDYNAAMDNLDKEEKSIREKYNVDEFGNPVSAPNKSNTKRGKIGKTQAELAEDAKLRKQAYDNRLDTLRDQQAQEETVLVEGDDAKKKNEKDRERDMLALQVAFAQEKLDLAKKYGQKTGEAELELAHAQESLMKFGEGQTEELDKKDIEDRKKRDENIDKARKRITERNKKYNDEAKKDQDEQIKLRAELYGDDTEKAINAENVRYATEEEKWKGHLDVELLLYAEHVKKLNEIRENDAVKAEKDNKQLEDAFVGSFKGIIDKALSPLEKKMQETNDVAGQFVMGLLKKVIDIEEDKLLKGLFSPEKSEVTPTGYENNPFGAFAPTMASYDAGGVVPKDQIARVHKGEMVLNKSQSDVFRNMASYDDGTLNGFQKRYIERIKRNTTEQLNAQPTQFGGIINSEEIKQESIATLAHVALKTGVEIGADLVEKELPEIGGTTLGVGAGLLFDAAPAEGKERRHFQSEPALAGYDPVRAAHMSATDRDQYVQSLTKTQDNTQSTEKNTVSVQEATKATTALITTLNGGKKVGASKTLESATTIAPLAEKLLGGDPSAKNSVTGWIGTLAPVLGLLGLSEGGVGHYGKGTLAVLHGNEVTAPASSFADYSARMLEIGMKAAAKGGNTTLNNNNTFKVDFKADGDTLRAVSSYNTVHDQITRAN